MASTKQVETERWLEFCNLFSNGNRGRLLSVTLNDDEMGFQLLAEDLPLMGLDYDPIKKGDDMIVSLGKGSLEFSHAIAAPIEMWEHQNDKGVVTSIEIMDQNNNKLILTFN